MTLYDDLFARATSPEALEPGECWVWTNAKKGNGYGHLKLPNGRYGGAHRVAYELAYGPVEEALVIDHMCRVIACYRPSHLRAVTRRQNTIAAGSLSNPAINARKTHCKNGHPLVNENLVASQARRGHPECHAYPSWTPIRHLAAVPDVPVTRSTAWAEREDDTWIDRM